MCYPVKCSVCGKTTWAGCGQHIDSVKASVPAADWCPGHDEATKNARSASGFFGLFGRGR